MSFRLLTPVPIYKRVNRAQSLEEGREDGLSSSAGGAGLYDGDMRGL